MKYGTIRLYFFRALILKVMLYILHFIHRLHFALAVGSVSVSMVCCELSKEKKFCSCKCEPFVWLALPRSRRLSKRRMTRTLLRMRRKRSALVYIPSWARQLQMFWPLCNRNSAKWSPSMDLISFIGRSTYGINQFLDVTLLTEAHYLSTVPFYLAYYNHLSERRTRVACYERANDIL